MISDILFVCAGKSESFDFAKPIGVGLVNSAIELTKLCLQNKPKEVVFVGTAGSYGELKIGEKVYSDLSANVEISYIEQKSFTPLSECIVSRETLTNKIVNSSNFITADANIAKRFLDIGYDLENMEFFSVQKVASNFGIPSRGVFYVTNYCNENAHEDFLAHHDEAKKFLDEYFMRFCVENLYKGIKL